MYYKGFSLSADGSLYKVEANTESLESGALVIIVFAVIAASIAVFGANREEDF